MEIASKLASLFLLSMLLLSTKFSYSIAMKTPPPITKPKSIAINLIHSSLILPKYWNTLRRTKNYSPDEVEEGLFATEDLLFFINFTLGEPPVSQVALLDSASRQIWVICYPCVRCPRRDSLTNYHPFRSRSYESVNCSDPICAQVSTYGCVKYSPECFFSATYDMKTNASGSVMTEHMSLQETDGYVVVIPWRQALGCAMVAHLKEKFKDTRFHGVFGLGFYDYNGSFLERIGGAFSYCIENLDDPRIANAILRFDDSDAGWDGEATPLAVNKANTGVYSVSLQDITISDDNQSLEIKPHDAVLDTGTEYMWLSKEHYVKMREMIKTLLDKIGLGLRERHTQNPMRLCYKGNVNTELDGKMPNIKLWFPNQVYMELNSPQSIFKQATPRSFCLAMETLRSDITNVTVIGLRAQQLYSMAYVVEESQLYYYKVKSCKSDY